MSTINSRLNRNNGSSGSISTSNNNNDNSIVKNSNNNEQRYKDLKEKSSRIREKRNQKEYEYSLAQKKYQECLNKAKELGINSLEELNQRITEKEKEETKNLDEFEAALLEEQEALEQIEEKQKRMSE